MFLSSKEREPEERKAFKALLVDRSSGENMHLPIGSSDGLLKMENGETRRTRIEGSVMAKHVVAIWKSETGFSIGGIIKYETAWVQPPNYSLIP